MIKKIYANFGRVNCRINNNGNYNCSVVGHAIGQSSKKRIINSMSCLWCNHDFGNGKRVNRNFNCDSLWFYL